MIEGLFRPLLKTPLSAEWLRPDWWFIVGLIAVVATASVLPCHGAGARAFGILAVAAIASLFFLQGARLSREAIVAGTHWRLHLAIASSTFILLPLLGLGLHALGEHQLPSLLLIGIMYLCVLPSTGHCQLSGPRAPFSGPLGLSGAA